MDYLEWQDVPHRDRFAGAERECRKEQKPGTLLAEEDHQEQMIARLPVTN